jgi:hypothetical protein
MQIFTGASCFSKLKLFIENYFQKQNTKFNIVLYNNSQINNGYLVANLTL